MKQYKEPLIIVTGAAGFIGSHIVRKLNEQGNTNLLLVDDLGKSDKWKNLVGKSFVDLISKHALFEWLKGRESQVKSIIHLGACSSTTEPDATYLLENNYRYSKNLAEIALRHNHRFIYASSAATYGDGAEGFNDIDDQINSLSPLNMYGYSKHMFDLWLKHEGLLSKTVGLKYFNVFGPNENHKGRMASAICHMLPQIKNEGKIKLFASSEPEKFKDGEQVRDFVWVDDVARMTTAFLGNDAGGIFNIATGKPTTWNELAGALFTSLNKKPSIDYISMPQDLMGKYQNYTCADMTKTRKVLGAAANTTSIPDAVQTYVKDYLLPGKLW